MRPHTPLSESVELLVDRRQICTIVMVRGDLNRDTTVGIRDRLLPVLRHTTTSVIFDLSEMTSCDAAGLALLVGARRRARLHGFSAVLAAPHPDVSKLLRSTGLHRIFTIHPSVSTAMLHQSPAPDLPAAFPTNSKPAMLQFANPGRSRNL